MHKFSESNSLQYFSQNFVAKFPDIYIEREKKSLCHVAMVAKFLDDNKPKMSLKKSHSFKLQQPCSVSFDLSNVGDIFWG